MNLIKFIASLFKRKVGPSVNEPPEAIDSNEKESRITPRPFKTFTDQYAPKEIVYLEQLILYRLNHYFPSVAEASAPVLRISEWSDRLKEFINLHHLSADESVLLLIALAPHMQPDLFDRIIAYKMQGSGDFQKIGGQRGKGFRGFLPTGETAVFLIGEDNYQRRLQLMQLFWADHLFEKGKILWLDDAAYGEPAMSGKLMLSTEYLETFLYGKPMPPKFSMNFPARLIPAGALTWDDLVINDELKDKISELKRWLKFHDQLADEWGMKSRLKKGYRTLFYGPSGTGKTFTAGLLGKEVGKDVYKIDLSMVVSKYIGETEKNLELLFARAEDKGWILFFDEADALFGKRTNVRDAHDKYANQEVSYLLQRIEDYNGMVILATNMKNNIDDAFMRRFNAVLKFSLPEPDERAKIWRLSFPRGAGFSDKETSKAVDIPELVKNYPISGGSIMNVVHYASIMAIERYKASGEDNKNPSKTIYLTDVLNGIKKELLKEGKPFS